MQNEYIKRKKKKNITKNMFHESCDVQLNFDLLKNPFLMHCRFLLALRFYSMFPWPFRISIQWKNLQAFLAPSGLSSGTSGVDWPTHTLIHVRTHAQLTSPFPIHQTYAAGYVLNRCYFYVVSVRDVPS